MRKAMLLLSDDGDTEGGLAMAVVCGEDTTVNVDADCNAVVDDASGNPSSLSHVILIHRGRG